MNAARILWGQVLTVCSIALAFLWAATQWTAAQLGHPWFMAGRYPVYHPPAFFWWWFAYDTYAPHVFQTGAYIAAAGGFASVVVAIAMSVWRSREAKHSETYGSAQWATDREVRAAGPLEEDGLLLGAPAVGRDRVRVHHPDPRAGRPHRRAAEHGSGAVRRPSVDPSKSAWRRNSGRALPPSR